ncbi:MAG: FG-GAP-like repeat-containing protein, partial [Candidatus Bipolaricaulota bacterium]
MKIIHQAFCFIVLMGLPIGCLGTDEPMFMATELEFGSSPSMSSEIGDLDGDGDLDVLVVRKLRAAAIFLNDGTGTFVLGDQQFPRLDLRDASIADLDADGDLDIVLVQNRGPNLVLLNDGAGGFETLSQELGQGSGIGVEIGDLDGDGDLDLFLAGYEAPLTIWFNDGAGRFELSSQVFESAKNRKFALGDLDGDGDLDAVIPRDFGESSVVLLNDGTGHFNTTPSGLATAGVNGFNAALGDIDGDGDLDLLHNC